MSQKTFEKIRGNLTEVGLSEAPSGAKDHETEAPLLTTSFDLKEHLSVPVVPFSKKASSGAYTSIAVTKSIPEEKLDDAKKCLIVSLNCVYLGQNKST